MFAGIKVGEFLALVAAPVGEFVATDKGLDYIVLTAQGTFDTPLIFAATALPAVAGIALFWIMDSLERRLIPGTPPAVRSAGNIQAALAIQVAMRPCQETSAVPPTSHAASAA